MNVSACLGARPKKKGSGSMDLLAMAMDASGPREGARQFSVAPCSSHKR